MLKKISSKLKDNKHNQNVIIKAVLSITHAIKLNEVTQKIKNIYTKLKNNYRIQLEADLAQDPQYKGLKTELLQTLKKLRKEIEKSNKKKANEFIQKRVNEIQSQWINNPSRFFAKAQPDNICTSQQL